MLQPQERGVRSRCAQQASEHREQRSRCSDLGLASPSCSQPGRAGQFGYKGGSITGFPRHKALEPVWGLQDTSQLGDQKFQQHRFVPAGTIPQAHPVPHSPPQRLHFSHFFLSLPLRPPATSAAPAAPLALSSPRGPQHRSGLINPRWAPECPSQPHASHPPGRARACLRGRCRGPGPAPPAPVAAWAHGAGDPHGGHPDLASGQLPPRAPGKPQAGRS